MPPVLHVKGRTAIPIPLQCVGVGLDHFIGQVAIETLEEEGRKIHASNAVLPEIAGLRRAEV